MSHRFRWLFVFAVALFPTAALHAADIPRPRPPPSYKTPIVFSVPFTWTGFYLGLQAGYGWARPSYETSFGTSPSFNVRGALAGSTFGYNVQLGPTVYGIETDIAYSWLKGSNGSTGPCPGCEFRNTWLGTTRGRLGYAADGWLSYVTGGLAYGDVRISDTFGGSETKTRLGWTAGAGLERAFGNRWSTKLEYLYTDLGTVAVGGPTRARFDASMVRTGINVKF